MAYDNTLIADIMKDIGCGDGFHIPVANEENQLLENEVVLNYVSIIALLLLFIIRVLKVREIYFLEIFHKIFNFYEK